MDGFKKTWKTTYNKTSVNNGISPRLPTWFWGMFADCVGHMSLKLLYFDVASYISHEPSFAAIHFVACSIRAMALRCLLCSVARFARCFSFLGEFPSNLSLLNSSRFNNQGISVIIFVVVSIIFVVGSIGNKEHWPSKGKKMKAMCFSDVSGA